MPRPRTTTELLAAAARALVERDTFALDELQRQAADWLQRDDEAAALGLLLEAMLEAACLLEGEPSEVRLPDDDARYERDLAPTG